MIHKEEWLQDVVGGNGEGAPSVTTISAVVDGDGLDPASRHGKKRKKKKKKGSTVTIDSIFEAISIPAGSGGKYK